MANQKPSLLTKLTEARTSQQYAMMSRDSITWLKRKVAQIRQPQAIARGIKGETDRNRIVQKFLKGGLYFFFYGPKGKDDLPYYDSFPLVLVLERYADGFLGLNLHYLPIKQRILILSKLIAYGAIYDENDELKRIRITYDILQSTKRFKEFRPCLKKYLYTNIKSKLLAVQPDEWDVAVMLPAHQFKKAKAPEVWAESMEQIKENS
jgi:hypothetical protein